MIKNLLNLHEKEEKTKLIQKLITDFNKLFKKRGEPHSPKSKIMEEASFVMNTREEEQNLAELSNLS